MGKIRIDEFVRQYERLYYNPDSCPDGYKCQYYGAKEGLEEIYKDLLKDYLSISKLNVTDYRAEEKVMELLYSSTFNEISLAWKAGKVGWENDQLITADSFEKDNYYVNGYGGRISKDGFHKYCHELEAIKEDINDDVENGNWKEAYKKVMKNSPDNIGPVYNINTLFFLTGGKAPIYDAFAHKAVKALLFNISPSEVYLGGNPNKNDVDKVVAMYQEYILLLKMLFEDWFKTKKKEDMFIPRELDRALWVYGHSTKAPDKFQTDNF